jgi:hypothetical protein
MQNCLIVNGRNSDKEPDFIFLAVSLKLNE